MRLFLKLTHALIQELEGFSIDDGELRSYDAPENKEFLATLMRAEIPNVLLIMGRMVNVDVKDHSYEDQKKTTVVDFFKGSDHTLGSATLKSHLL